MNKEKVAVAEFILNPREEGWYAFRGVVLSSIGVQIMSLDDFVRVSCVGGMRVVDVVGNVSPIPLRMFSGMWSGPYETIGDAIED